MWNGPRAAIRANPGASASSATIERAESFPNQGWMNALGVGLLLPASAAHLDSLEGLLPQADYFEICPEAAWISATSDDEDAKRRWTNLRDRSGKPFVGHGVGWSPGTPLLASGPEAERSHNWLARIAHCHQLFDFQWYSDHLGFSATVEGWQTVLPLPLPPTQAAAAAVRARMQALSKVIPAVGFENSVFYFSMVARADEPWLCNSFAEAADCHIVLDVHNIYTVCLNSGVEPMAFLERFDTQRVIEIHLSGGSESEPDWLAGGQMLRLDSHDGPIPEPVWELASRALELCPNVRGLTLERLDGTLEPEEVTGFEREFARARQLWSSRRPQPASPAHCLSLVTGVPLEPLQQAVAVALHRDWSVTDLLPELTQEDREFFEQVDPAGFELSSILVRNLRVSRILRSSPHLRGELKDPAELDKLRTYLDETDPLLYFAGEEGLKYEKFR